MRLPVALPHSVTCHCSQRAVQSEKRYIHVAFAVVVVWATALSPDRVTSLVHPCWAHNFMLRGLGVWSWQLKTYFNITKNSSDADSNKFNFNYNMLYSVYSFPNMVRGRAGAPTSSLDRGWLWDMLLPGRDVASGRPLVVAVGGCRVAALVSFILASRDV